MSFGLAIALVFATVGCTQGPSFSPFPPCDPAQAPRAERLREVPILHSLPTGAEQEARYSKLPCEDEDGTGVAGWTGSLPTAGEEAIREYYRQVSGADGWTLKGETPSIPFDGLDMSTLGMCFENPGYQGVILTVDFSGRPREPQKQLWVELKFADKDLTCARYSR